MLPFYNTAYGAADRNTFRNSYARPDRAAKHVSKRFGRGGAQPIDDLQGHNIVSERFGRAYKERVRVRAHAPFGGEGHVMPLLPEKKCLFCLVVVMPGGVEA